MNRIEFIAILFVFALCGLLVGGMNLYERLEFAVNGERATMELADPSKKRVIAPGDKGLHMLDVRLVGKQGTVVVPGKRLLGETARIVGSGGSVPVTYLKHKPHHALEPGEELDSPWGWLVVGFSGLALFVYALRLRRREAAQPHGKVRSSAGR